MKLVYWVVGNALALAAATWFLDGMEVTGASTTDRVVTMLGVAVVFGLVNAILRPIVKLLAFPLILLTLGLLIFVINAAMLLVTGWLSQRVGLQFTVDGFLTALAGAAIIMVTSWLLGLVLPDDDT